LIELSQNSQPISAVRSWSMIGLGLAVNAVLVFFSPQLAMKSPYQSELGLTATVYFMIFVPMAATGMFFAHVEGFTAFRLGSAPKRWSAIGLSSGVAGLVLAVAIASFGATLVVGQGAVIGATIVAGSALILFQVSSEEIFFRGWLFRAIEGSAGASAAICLSALVFAGFHLLGGTRSALTLANLLLGGIWFGLLAWRSGGLVASLLAHFSWNATEELIAGLSPNPGTGQFGALVDLDLMGKPLWGGSEEGLNASVAMSIVLVALILPLVLQRTAASAPFVSGPRSNGPLS